MAECSALCLPHSRVKTDRAAMRRKESVWVMFWLFHFSRSLTKASHTSTPKKAQSYKMSRRKMGKCGRWHNHSHGWNLYQVQQHYLKMWLLGNRRKTTGIFLNKNFPSREVKERYFGIRKRFFLWLLQKNLRKCGKWVGNETRKSFECHATEFEFDLLGSKILR